MRERYIIDFPCNECCLTSNRTMISKYDLLEEENEKYKMKILISVAYILINIIMKRKKYNNKTFKKNKVKVNYEDITIFF